MDEHEGINRREVATGLALMTALMVALVGTIVYRIVDGAPGRVRPSSALVNAGKAPATMAVNDAPLKIQDDSILNASHGAEQADAAASATQPRFVAPANR